MKILSKWLPKSVLLSATAIATVPALLFTTPQIAFAQDYTPIKRLGTNEAVCVGGIETADELKGFFENDADIVAQILADANWPGNHDDLNAAIANDQFVEKSYAPGTRFDWMSAKRKGNGVALPYREWAGKDDFIGYEVQIESNCQVHTLVIPKICCNISLAASEPVAVDAPIVSVSSTDATLSVCTDPGSEVMITAPDGTVSSVALDDNGCWSGEVAEGDYQVKAINPLCSGAESAASHTVALPVIPDPEPVVDAPAKTLIPFIGGFIGSEKRMRYEQVWDMDMEDSSGVVGLKAGLMKMLSESTAIFGQVGFIHRHSINEGNIYPEREIYSSTSALIA